MKMKNFVIFGLVMLVAMLAGGGCSIVKTGKDANGIHYFNYGTPEIIGNASSTSITIINATNGIIDVFWGRALINVLEDKQTRSPVLPGEMLVFGNNTGWVGEQVSLVARIRDGNDSRNLGFVSEIFQIHYQRGVVSINWIIKTKNGKFIGEVNEIGGFFGRGGFYGY